MPGTCWSVNLCTDPVARSGADPEALVGLDRLDPQPIELQRRQGGDHVGILAAPAGDR